MDDIQFGLADLEVQDDLNVSMDNETYQDQANPAPPAAGNYGAKILKFDARRDKDKKPVFKGGDPRFPVLQIVSAELVEGLGDGVTRKVGLFYDIDTKPFDRFGVPASGLGDITRAYGTDSWSGIPNGIELLKEAIQGNQLFYAQYDWNVYDKEFVEAAKEQLGLANSTRDSRDANESEKKLYNAMYRAASVTGMRFFPYNPDTGKFSHMFVRGDVQVKNPTTNAIVTVEVPQRSLEARLTITRFFPKTQAESGRIVGGIGPAKTKPQALKVA